jgi:hypothetical protein
MRGCCGRCEQVSGAYRNVENIRLFGCENRKIHQKLSFPQTVTSFALTPLSEPTVLKTGFCLDQHSATLYCGLGLLASDAVNVFCKLTQLLLMRRREAAVIGALRDRHLMLLVCKLKSKWKRKKCQYFQYDGNLAGLKHENIYAFPVTMAFESMRPALARETSCSSTRETRRLVEALKRRG